MTYPTITPKLTLDFANSRQLDPRITFSRSSTATYLNPDTGLITTAPTGVARFEKEGFLIEESRTNSVTNSQVFQSGYNTNGLTTTDNAAVAPDGTTTAASIMELGGSSTSHGFFKTTTSLSGFAQSIFVKPNGRDNICLRFAVPGVGNWYTITFNLTGNGSVTQEEYGSAETWTFESKNIQPFGNGWYRISAAASTSTATTIDLIVDGCTSSTPTLLSSDGAERYIGDTTKGYYVWGAQVEAADFPTSYIPTSGSTVTRAADVASITGTNFSGWYGGLSGTFAHESLNNSNAASIPLVCDDGTNANRILFNNSGSYQLQIRVSGATIVQMDANPGTAPSGMTKYAGSYEVGNASVSFDGVSATTTASDIPQCSRLQISQFSGNSKFNTISRISYYDRRVSNAELETLTS